MLQANHGIQQMQVVTEEYVCQEKKQWDEHKNIVECYYQ